VEVGGDVHGRARKGDAIPGVGILRSWAGARPREELFRRD